jgi:hypothetical protein
MEVSHEYLILQLQLHLWNLLKNVMQFIKQYTISQSLKVNKNTFENPLKQYWLLYTNSML